MDIGVRSITGVDFGNTLEFAEVRYSPHYERREFDYF
jgi:hypothetical protein